MATMMMSLSALEAADNGDDDEAVVATMMMSWSALETADNGGDDDVVISAGGG
jgi:hypothetical protein